VQAMTSIFTSWLAIRSMISKAKLRTSSTDLGP
jgi:hypothetical protein